MTLTIAVDPVKKSCKEIFVPTQDLKRIEVVADGQGVMYGAAMAGGAEGGAAVIDKIDALVRAGLHLTVASEGGARVPGSSEGSGFTPLKGLKGEPQVGRDGKVGFATSGGPTQALAIAAEYYNSKNSISPAKGSPPTVKAISSICEGEATAFAYFAEKVRGGTPVVDFSIKKQLSKPVLTSFSASSFSSKILPLCDPPLVDLNKPKILDPTSYVPLSRPSPASDPLYSSNPFSPFPTPQSSLLLTALSYDSENPPSLSSRSYSAPSDPVYPTKSQIEELLDCQEDLSEDELRAIAKESVVGFPPPFPFPSSTDNEQTRAQPKSDSPRAVIVWALDTDAAIGLPPWALVIRRIRLVDGGAILTYYRVGDALVRAMDSTKRTIVSTRSAGLKVDPPSDDAPEVAWVVKMEEAEEEQRENAEESLGSYAEEKGAVQGMVIDDDGVGGSFGGREGSAMDTGSERERREDSDDDVIIDESSLVPARPVKEEESDGTEDEEKRRKEEKERRRREKKERKKRKKEKKDRKGKGKEVDTEKIKEEEEEEEEPEEISFTLAPDRTSINQLSALVSIIHRDWKDSKEFSKAVSDPKVLLTSTILGSAHFDDDTSNLRDQGVKHYVGPARATALAFFAKNDVRKFYSLMVEAGYRCLDGYEGFKRSILGRIFTLGTFDSYSSAQPTFLAGLAPNSVAEDIVTALLNDPENMRILLPIGTLSPTPENAFKLYSDLGGLPVAGMSSLDPLFAFGNAQPGTISRLSGNSSLWTRQQREERVPPYVVNFALSMRNETAKMRQLEEKRLARVEVEEEDEETGRLECLDSKFREEEEEAEEGEEAADEEDMAPANRNTAKSHARSWRNRAKKKEGERAENAKAVEEILRAVARTKSFSSKYGGEEIDVDVFPTKRIGSLEVRSKVLHIEATWDYVHVVSQFASSLESARKLLEDEPLVKRFFPREGYSPSLAIELTQRVEDGYAAFVVPFSAFVVRFCEEARIPPIEPGLDRYLGLRYRGVFGSSSLFTRSRVLAARLLSVSVKAGNTRVRQIQKLETIVKLFQLSNLDPATLKPESLEDYVRSKHQNRDYVYKGLVEINTDKEVKELRSILQDLGLDF
ncbi:uncharacterized protein JCM6883_001741 [Sporobolomyces salmoneus]|uniref:uncharacterized protein n=1 Tax=Sporobolomyces salmoneus TaxID=183962 RepID=UPI00317D06DC